MENFLCLIDMVLTLMLLGMFIFMYGATKVANTVIDTFRPTKMTNRAKEVMHSMKNMMKF